MSREFLLLVQESAYKTPVTTPIVWPTTSANAFYIRLDGANAFTMRPRPVMVAVPYGGGVAIDAFRVSDKIECKGRLLCKLYAGALSQFLIQWAAQTINTAQTAPGPPRSPPATWPAFRATTRSSDRTARSSGGSTWVRRSMAGTSRSARTARSRRSPWTYRRPPRKATSSTALPILRSTTSPPPTDSQLPTNPYVFIHASGNLTIGSARTQFQSVKLSCKNQLARRYWANRFVNLMRFVGRSTTLEAVNFYAPTPDDRTSYEGLTTETTSFELNNGTHSITINMNTASVITTFEDQLPLNDLYTQTMTITNQWDSTAGSDLALTFT